MFVGWTHKNMYLQFMVQLLCCLQTHTHQNTFLIIFWTLLKIPRFNQFVTYLSIWLKGLRRVDVHILENFWWDQKSLYCPMETFTMPLLARKPLVYSENTFIKKISLFTSTFLINLHTPLWWIVLELREPHMDGRTSKCLQLCAKKIKKKTIYKNLFSLRF